MTDHNDNTLNELLDRMKKGGRVSRDDLPESLLILEECINLHSAEYAVKYQHLEDKLAAAEQTIELQKELLQVANNEIKTKDTANNQLLEEARKVENALKVATDRLSVLEKQQGTGE